MSTEQRFSIAAIIVLALLLGFFVGMAALAFADANPIGIAAVMLACLPAGAIWLLMIDLRGEGF